MLRGRVAATISAAALYFLSRRSATAINTQQVITALGEISASEMSRLLKTVEEHNKIILLGNGGSNSIAAHIAQDLTKVSGKRAVTFSDPSRLTCYINDYGMDQAYRMFLQHFADSDSLVILISSSGNSANVLNAGKYCLEKNIALGILTGFEAHNSMRTAFKNMAKFDLWVNSHDYGVVECSHQVILHCAVTAPSK